MDAAEEEEEEEENLQTKPLASQTTPFVQRQVELEEEEEEVQAKSLAQYITPLVQRQAEEEKIQAKPTDGERSAPIQWEEETESQRKFPAEQSTPLVHRQPAEQEKELGQQTLRESIQHQTDEEEKESVQTKPVSGGVRNVPEELRRRIESRRGGGRPLSKGEKAFFEPRFGYNFRHVRIHTDGNAATLVRDSNAQAFTRGRDIFFASGQYSPHTSEGKRLLSHELTHFIQQSGRQTPVCIQRKIDFEFDLNYGMEETAPPTSSEANQIEDDEVLTTHERRTHGFKVIQDGNRMEISTKRFGLGEQGGRKLAETMTNIMAFVNELQSGCRSAGPRRVRVPRDSIIKRALLQGRKRLGRPRYFYLASSRRPGRPVFPLGSMVYFRKSCGVSAAPQATFDVPLAGVSGLVTEIKESRGKGPGIALTGSRSLRPGLRSDAIFRAQSAVNSSRLRHLNRTRLTDGTLVTERNFSPNLQGFMILLVSYLLAGEITSPKDYETYAKAYPPIVTHTRFRDMFHRILSQDERDVFLDLYGNPDVRNNLYALAARRRGGVRRPLFPARVAEQQIEYFGVRHTWDDLVEYTIQDRPLITMEMEESMFTPLATAKPLSKTRAEKRGIERVSLELRRIAFTWVPASRWQGLTDMVFKLARRLDGRDPETGRFRGR